MESLVSIIVPVYNTAEYVEECIQSILSQTYKNIELILVNDGSTDGSGEICKKYISQPNVQYIEQENMGPQDSRKHGVEMASGEWVMFVDSDDYLQKDCIRDLMLLTDDVDIVLGGFTRQTKFINDTYLNRKDYLYALYMRKIHHTPWGKLFRSELIRRCPLAFAYNFRLHEDLLMNLAIGRINDKKVAVSNKPAYYYRSRMESLSHVNQSLDFYNDICNLEYSIVAGGLSEKELKLCDIYNRIHYYLKFLQMNDYQANKTHPLVKDVIGLMNEEKVVRLSDRIILLASSRRAMKICFFIRKIIIRIEQPALIVKDCKRLYNHLKVNTQPVLL